MIPEKLHKKLEERKKQNIFRVLGIENQLIDFSSNDYLGFAKDAEIFEKTHQILIQKNIVKNGATGSRLISGNNDLYNEIEEYLANVHQSEEALLFNSGYTANLGLFSSILTRESVVLYDELSHASIRDGIKLSDAKSYKFKHNDLSDLELKLQKFKDVTIYIVTESVFSMDGDTPDLKKMSDLSEKYDAYLIVDEAHAFGVFGLGLVQELGLQDKIFARVITFGKALGCHGAVILGATELKEYLINFCRPFIYTTGMPPHQLMTIYVSYQKLMCCEEREKLRKNIRYFKSLTQNMNFIFSDSPIQSLLIRDSVEAKKLASELCSKKFDVKAILSPTVPKGTERIRFCIHTYNTFEEIEKITNLIREKIINLKN